MSHFNDEEEHAAASEIKEEEVDNEYYGFLNLPRNASNADITAAYKRLARLYHPDKHQDEAKRAEAELLFTKLKTCYEVLSDPHKRAIYDCLGKKGLKEQGWALVQRTKTPREIREEYETLARLREERRLHQRTKPESRFQMVINATDLFDRYLYDAEYDEIIDSELPRFEVSRLSLHQSIKAPLTTTDTATLSGNITASNGRGDGSFTCGYRRLRSQTCWQEFNVSLGNGLGLDTKVYRELASRLFVNMSGTLQFARGDLKPGFSTTFESHLDKHTVGYLTYSTHLKVVETEDSINLEQEQSGMETMIVRDTPGYYTVCSLQLGIPHTYATLSYTKKMPDSKKRLRVAVKVGTFGGILEYGVDEQITEHSTLGATMIVGFPVGVTVRLKLVRSTQTYTFPFHLSDEILLQPIFYGTVVPLLAWFTLKRLVLDPYDRRRREADRERRREANKEKVEADRREAVASCSLMAERFNRIVREEEEKGGLVIVAALYGLLATEKGELVPELKSLEAKGDTTAKENSYIDITLPVQCSVEDSRLVLWEGSKSSLPGVWDPTPGEEKYILIKYLYQHNLHQLFCPETEVIKLPKNAHRIPVP